MAKIGIYSGVFDPVHDGHIAFARAAIASDKVDTVYFMLEVNPRRKHQVTDAVHRRAMLTAALQDELNLELLDASQPTLSVRDTLPWLTQQFGDADLCVMMGSDLFVYLQSWPDYQQLRRSVSFGVAVREGQTVDESKLTNTDWVIPSPLPTTSSSQIRVGASQHTPQAVRDYITTHRLYAY